MYRKKMSGWLANIDFIIIDILAVEISFFIAYFLRLGGDEPFKENKFGNMYLKVMLALALASFIQSIMLNIYKNILQRGLYTELRNTIIFSSINTIVLIIYLYMAKIGDYSRIICGLTWIFDILITYMFRIIWKSVKNSFMTTVYKNNCSLIVISTSDMINKTIESATKMNNVVIRGIIIMDKEMTGQEIEGIEVVAGKEDLLPYICRNWVDEIFVNMSDEYDDTMTEIIDDCVTMGITVHRKLAKKKNIPGLSQIVENLGDYTVLSTSMNTASTYQLMVKRALDILGGLVGTLITLILTIFIGPIIFIKSPGPIFFKQCRIGKNGKKFYMYKFRSMYLDAEERKAELLAQNKIKDGMMFKIENDPRIIGGENGKGIGNFIRKTSLDEFPQFFNVLKGDMSLVGTRPPTLDEWEKYKIHHRKRMSVKPGITGLWQISGRSNIIDFEEVVKLDTEYITNWSFGEDIKILVKTVMVVLKHNDSY